jgi:hypothetical protein
MVMDLGVRHLWNITTYKKLPQCIVVANNPRCSKCVHDQHKCIWNGETRTIVEGEVEIRKRSKRILTQSAKVIEL